MMFALPRGTEAVCQLIELQQRGGGRWKKYLLRRWPGPEQLIIPTPNARFAVARKTVPALTGSIAAFG